jgi:large subunit ribosomal protein L15
VPENFEGGQMPLHMRIPKLKGFSNPFKVRYQVVNLTRIVELFPHGGVIGVEDLILAGAVRDSCLVKVLGNGEISVSLDISAHAFSASAKQKIEQAGGSVHEL